MIDMKEYREYLRVVKTLGALGEDRNRTIRECEWSKREFAESDEEMRQMNGGTRALSTRSKGCDDEHPGAAVP